MVENLRSKTLYKAALGLLKVIPMILALVALLNSILSYFCIDLPILSYIGGVSIFTLIFLYLSSYVFRFCPCHRMFLHYVAVIWLINIIDCYIGIPISDLEYLCLQMIVTGVSLFILLYMYVKNYKRTSSKDN